MRKRIDRTSCTGSLVLGSSIRLQGERRESGGGIEAGRKEQEIKTWARNSSDHPPKGMVKKTGKEGLRL